MCNGRHYSGLILLLALWVPQALGQISNVAVAPGSVQMDVTTGLNTLVNWSVSFSGADALSRRGEFLGSRTVLGTNSTLLRISLPLGANGRVTRSQREPLVVTPAMARRWWDLGLRQVTYRREFRTNSSDARTASVVLNLTGPRLPPTPPTEPPSPQPPGQPEPPPVAPPSVPPTVPPVVEPPSQPTPPPALPPPGRQPPSVPPGVETPPRTQQPPTLREPETGLGGLRRPGQAALTIYRLELAFEDMSVVQFVNQDTVLKARLRVSYAGSGLLRGRWMLAGPGSTVGKPLFAPLQSVNQQLTSSQRSEVMSPALPTGTAGRYYLLFCADAEVEVQAADELQLETVCPNALISTSVGYQVFPADSQQTIEADTQPSQGLIDAQTRFFWRRVPEAALYQLQLVAAAGRDAQRHEEGILHADPAEFVGGMVLDSDTLSTRLSEVLLGQLLPEVSYSWRVTAYDDAGRLLGASTPQIRRIGVRRADQQTPTRTLEADLR